MTTPIRLPDGSEVEIATDDPKQAAAAARKIWDRQQGQRQPATPKPLNTFRAAVGNAVDSIIPNWGDEVAGAGRWLGAHLGSSRDPKTAFAEGQREFLEEQRRYKEERPNLHTATAVGGTALGLVAPVGRVAKGAGMAAKMAHGAAVGAGYGAVSGAGEGEGLAERGNNAVRSAAIGAGLGAAATPFLAGASRAGRFVGDKARLIPGVETATRRLANVPRAVWGKPRIAPGQRAREAADRMLADKMTEGRIQTGMGQQGPASSPEAITAELNRRQAMTVPAIVGDTTEAMRNVTSWASRGAGPGQTMVRQALDARKVQEAARVRQHITDELGPVVDPIAQAEQMAARTREAAAPMYRQAYNEPMVVTPEIEGIMRTPAFQDALPHAVRNIRNAQRDPTALGFRMDADGNIEGLQGLSTEGFDQVIRAMRDTGRAAADVNPLTGQVRNTTNSVHINARAGDLRAHLAEQNPVYAEVTSRYADDMAQRDALQRGGEVRGLTGPEINAQRRAMPENAQEAWAIGARSALADDASKFGAEHPNGDTAARVRQALGDDTKQEAIGQMTGNTGAVRGLQDRLEAEHQGNILWKEVQGNSRTASRQAMDADLNQTSGGGSSLTVRGMLTGVMNHIAAQGASQYRKDLKARIAEVVTASNPATVQDLMAAIADRAQRDAEFMDLLYRSGLIEAKALGANIEPERREEPADY